MYGQIKVYSFGCNKSSDIRLDDENECSLKAVLRASFDEKVRITEEKKRRL